jgi:hypothetical protein
LKKLAGGIFREEIRNGTRLKGFFNEEGEKQTIGIIVRYLMLVNLVRSRSSGSRLANNKRVSVRAVLMDQVIKRAAKR